jgi:hypothetical protein
MALPDIFLRWFLKVESPSNKAAKFAHTNIVKPFLKGLKQGKKDRKKYNKIRKKFETKWLKQNQHWSDTRQKAKALEKAFLKEYPQYKFYAQMERLGRKCKI